MNGNAAANEQKERATNAKIVVLGPAGSGKTSVGRRVAQALGARFLDADDFHFPDAIEKMRAGVGLTDEDRLPWLARLATLLRDSAKNGPVVLACSALKEKYREQLRRPAGEEPETPSVTFVYLRVERDELARRLRARRGHFAGLALLESQLEALEEPDEGIVDASGSLEEVCENVLHFLRSRTLPKV